MSDLFWFFARSTIPSGIQRLAVEAVAAMHRLEDREVDIALCRVSEASGRLVEVSLAEVLELFCHQRTGNPVLRSHDRRTLTNKIVAELRRFIQRRISRKQRSKPAVSALEIEPRPGDVLLCMGSHWIVEGYPAIVRRYCTEHGMLFALLCYDLIPLFHRQWVQKKMQMRFQTWFDGILPQTAAVLAISNHTAVQVQRYLSDGAKATPPVVAIRTGHGYPATFVTRTQTAGISESPLCVSGSFALFVSTIEVRKNHLFLVRIWQRLLENHAHSDVPQLVFVGRRGWMVGDLFDLLERTGYLGGKVEVVHNVSDILLDALYKGCTLAIYPSLEEGFGLPVAEAVMAGAICIASNRASMPEVVGEVIDYFDPYDFDAAYRLIEAAVFDDSYRENLRGRLKSFTPRSWHVTAQDILHAIECHALTRQQQDS